MGPALGGHLDPKQLLTQEQIVPMAKLLFTPNLHVGPVARACVCEREGPVGRVDPCMTRRHIDVVWKVHVAILATDENRVLACARCNGDEKRERDWREFLGEKCDDPAVLEHRRALIQTWVNTHPERHRAESPAVEEALRDAEQLVEDFHAACTRLREALKSDSV